MDLILRPFRLFLSGYDWTGRTRRPDFVLVAVVYFGLTLGAFWLRAKDPTASAPAGLLLALAAFWVVPVVGHTLRRLADIGRSGWWIWLLALPYLRWVLVAALLFGASAPARFYHEARARRAGYAVALVVAALHLVLALRTPVTIASASMRPSVLPGDVLLVRHDGAVRAVRGAVVVLRENGSGALVAARIAGLPGDQIAVAGGGAVISGIAAALSAPVPDSFVMRPEGPDGVLPRCANGAVGVGGTCAAWRITETLPTGARYAIHDLGAGPLDESASVTVPEGYYYLLGDNRDVAADSRVARAAGGLGLVAADEILGRATRVLYSYRGDHFWKIWTWRWRRTLEAVE